MRPLKDILPIAVTAVLIALLALVPLAIGGGSSDDLGSVRAATASYVGTNKEGAALQQLLQQKQQELTTAIANAAANGATTAQIAAVVAPIVGIPEQQALQGVAGIIAQAKQVPQAGTTPQAPTTTTTP